MEITQTHHANEMPSKELKASSILQQLDHPAQLELLYRQNPQTFRILFKELYPSISEHISAQCWNARLQDHVNKDAKISSREYLIAMVLIVCSGIVAKLPDWIPLDEPMYFAKNLVFCILPALSIYFAWKRNMSTLQKWLMLLAFLIAAVYINLLPAAHGSDTVLLACIHLPVCLWFVFGYAHVGSKWSNTNSRLAFLKYHGDLFVLSAILFISGAILSGMTIGLFHLIQLNIENFYFDHFVKWGLVAIPIIATMLIEHHPLLVKNVSPLIAKLLTPMVLLLLLVYSATVLYTGQDPFNDRNFLLLFNVLLLGVMAIVMFAVAETTQTKPHRLMHILLLLLSSMALLLNGIALAAICFRITEWGFTPNRTVILGNNVLIMGHLSMVAIQLFKALFKNAPKDGIQHSISRYLVVYGVWALFVSFILPFIYNFH